MTRRMVFAALCVAAVGCGGGGSGGNAAASREFSYGAPTTADSSQANAAQGSLTSALALQGSPGVENAQGVAQFSNVTSALLGSSVSISALTGTSRPAQERALTRARSALLSGEDFDGLDFDEACVVSTPTSVTLNNCTVNIDETEDGTTITGTITANGSVTLSNANQTLTWDVTVSANVSASGSDGSGSGGLNYHAAGTLTVIAPTDSAPGMIDGEMTSELGVHATANGQSFSVGVDEYLALNDLTVQAGPCVTGGTLEARRVWTSWSVPGESTPPPNRAALVTFGPACGEATIQIGTPN